MQQMSSFLWLLLNYLKPEKNHYLEIILDMKYPSTGVASYGFPFQADFHSFDLMDTDNGFPRMTVGEIFVFTGIRSPSLDF